MKVVTIVYLEELSEIGVEIVRYFKQENYIVFEFNLSIKNFEQLLVNFESSLKISDLVIPILYPVQKSNKVYDNQRIFFELSGDIEKEFNVFTLPIYLSSNKVEDLNLDQEMVRYPQQFFSNVFSLIWNSYISIDANIKTLKSKLGMLLEFEKQIGNGESNRQGNTEKRPEISEVRQKIRKDNLDEALKLFQKIIQNDSSRSELENELILLENRYNSLNTMTWSGTFKNEDLIREKARFTKQFLKIISSVE